jgi:hypothetical protein
MGTIGRGGDCDDTNAMISPAVAETCNGLDDDCDGTVDEGEAQTACRSANAVAGCIAGHCQIASCIAPYANCDANPDCEANLTTGSTCGSCGVQCPMLGALCGATDHCVPIPQGWSMNVSSMGGDGIADVIAGPGGALVTGGGHGYTFTIAGTSPSAGYFGTDDAWIGAFDTSGTLLWFREIATPGGDDINAIVVDPLTNAAFYAGGIYGAGSSTFSAPAVTAESGFVQNFDSNSGVNLAPTLSFAATSGSSNVWALDSSASGLTVAGWFSADVAIPAPAGSPTAAAVLTPASGAHDSFIARYSSAQLLQWYVQVVGDGDDQVYGIDVDAGGVTYAVIQSDSMNPSIGSPCTEPRIGLHDVVIVALDTSHNPIWWRRFGSLGDDAAADLVVSGGRVYVVGTVAPNATFGSGTLIAGHGGHDAFVAALDATTGHTLWANTYGGTADENGTALTLARGQLYLAMGTNVGTMQLGNVPYTTTYSQAIVVSLTTEGAVRWSMAYGAMGGGTWPIGLDYVGGSTLYTRSIWSGIYSFFGVGPISGYGSDMSLNAFDLATDG